MAVLPHEGTYAVMYGTYSTPAGSTYRSDYLARPDAVGRFPVVLITSGPGEISSHVKSVSRFLARQFARPRGLFGRLFLGGRLERSASTRHGLKRRQYPSMIRAIR